MFKIQKGYDSESKSFRLPVDLIRRLEELAAANKLSLNQLVIQCLNHAINDLESDEGEKKC
jgi:predicted HicB family RNase H-like nuclease